MYRSIALVLVLIGVRPAVAAPPDPKYAAIDAARAALVSALDRGDAAALTELLDATPVEVKDLWFDTKACRKKWKQASLTTKTAPAFVACMKGLSVSAVGLNVYYGPGVGLTVKLEYVDGKAVLRRLSGDPVAIDPALPTVAAKRFVAQRTEGQDIALDQAARDELVAAGDTGVVIKACVDAKGTVTSRGLLPKVAAKGPTATAVRTGLGGWKLTPFQVRGKPFGACAMLVVK